jgi:hypothetical protein
MACSVMATIAPAPDAEAVRVNIRLLAQPGRALALIGKFRRPQMQVQRR